MPKSKLRVEAARERIVVFLDDNVLRIDGVEHHMEALPLELMARLVSDFDKTVTHEQLAHTYQQYVMSRRIDSAKDVKGSVTGHLSYIRKVLKGTPVEVKKVWGVGYKLTMRTK